MAKRIRVNCPKCKSFQLKCSWNVDPDGKRSWTMTCERCGVMYGAEEFILSE